MFSHRKGMADAPNESALPRFPLSLTPIPVTVIVFAVLVAWVAIAIWAFNFPISENVSARGVITVPDAIQPIISPHSSRLIRELNLMPGQQVTEGQLVAILDTESLDIEITKLQAIHQFEQSAFDASLPIVQKSHEEAQRLLGVRLDANHRHLLRITESAAALEEVQDRTVEFSLSMTSELLNLYQEINDDNQEFERLAGTLREGTFTASQQLQNRIQLLDSRRNVLDEMLNAKQLEIQKAQASVQKDSIARQVEELGQASLQIQLEKLTSEQQFLQTVASMKKELLSSEASLELLLKRREMERNVIAPFSGRVLQVTKVAGQSADAGEPIAWVDRSSNDSREYCFLGYVDTGRGTLVSPGNEVLVSLDSYPAERHGSINGTILHVTPFNATESSVLSRIGHEQLSQQLLQENRFKEIVVGINYPALNWTGGEPNGFDGLQVGQTASAKVKLREMYPVDFVGNLFGIARKPEVFARPSAPEPQIEEGK